MINKSTKALIFFSFIIFFPASLFAQTRCPVGAQTGSAQCLPDDQGSSPSRPTGEWIKTWGSIVASESRGEAWTSVGKFSKDDAENEALGQCVASGSPDCSVILSYNNQCAAMASPSGDGPSEAVGGKNKEVAEKRAVSLCQKNSKMECQAVYSGCSDPFFRKF